MHASRYIDRETFILERAAGKRVLDCGVIGQTELEAGTRVNRFPSSLHVRIAGVAREAVGIDSADVTEEVAALHPELDIRRARIEEPPQERPFDLIILGDILEHLSNPGEALDALRPLLAGEIIVTCPNGFGAPSLLRFLLGRFREGGDHVASYNKWSLGNLLERHGYRPAELYTALDRPRAQPSAVFRLGRRLLQMFPEMGGTLVMVATRSDAGL